MHDDDRVLELYGGMAKRSTSNAAIPKLIVVKKMRERTTKVIPGGVRSEAEARMTDVV